MEARLTEIAARAESLANGLGQLSKWGYRVVRDEPACKDGPEREYETDLAACALLGLDATAANIASHPVSLVAQALTNAVTDQDKPTAASPPARMVILNSIGGISGRMFPPEQSAKKDAAE
uniref:hypothetical protein n=1 Tax=Cupriavidus gilardii TaxID=82541 RepID=UPI002479706D|nr:hypothetical protein [Cupriavidus gilardii]WDE72674.1 hypothetical protein [Cupriavidus gilardii]